MVKQTLVDKHGDLFVKFMFSLLTAAAIKMCVDLGDIKTTVALAVQRIEFLDQRLKEVEKKVD